MPVRIPFSRAARCSLAFALCLLACANAAAADWLGPVRGLFKSGDEEISTGGSGQFVKLVDQGWVDRHKRPPDNDHPAKLSAGELAAVLASLKVNRGENVTGAASSLFSTPVIGRLAEDVTRALALANKEQDIAFSGASEDGRLTAGRVFVSEGRLNIIFGDVLAAPGSDAGGDNHNASPHRIGKRDLVIDRDLQVGGGTGIVNWRTERSTRGDWVIVDVPKVVAAYRGPPLPAPAPPAEAVAPVMPQPAAAASPAATPPAPPVQQDSSALLRERRELLEEVARLRKELAESQEQVAPEPVAGRPSAATAPDDATDTDIEDRLRKLKVLHEKQLITDEEYAAKRRELLEEL